VIRVEGLDPDDPVVVTAIDLVRWQLSLYFGDQDTGDEPVDTGDSVPPLQLQRFIGHANVHYDLDRYAHLINTDDHAGNMAALGAMAAPKPSYGGKVIPLRR
jgi:hypothetical protein